MILSHNLALLECNLQSKYVCVYRCTWPNSHENLRLERWARRRICCYYGSSCWHDFWAWGKISSVWSVGVRDWACCVVVVSVLAKHRMVHVIVQAVQIKGSTISQVQKIPKRYRKRSHQSLHTHSSWDLKVFLGRSECLGFAWKLWPNGNLREQKSAQLY